MEGLEVRIIPSISSQTCCCGWLNWTGTPPTHVLLLVQIPEYIWRGIYILTVSNYTTLIFSFVELSCYVNAQTIFTCITHTSDIKVPDPTLLTDELLTIYSPCNPHPTYPQDLGRGHIKLQVACAPGQPLGKSVRLSGAERARSLPLKAAAVHSRLTTVHVSD